MPAALGVLLALLPLASTLQSQGKLRDPWAGLESWGRAGRSPHHRAWYNTCLKPEQHCTACKGCFLERL